MGGDDSTTTEGARSYRRVWRQLRQVFSRSKRRASPPAPPAPPKLRILFLCTGNACRSQMAEGWARALRPDRLEAFSAGTCPAGLDPLAVQVMAEAGVDISTHRSRHVMEFWNTPLDRVITLCDHAREVCPVSMLPAPAVHVGFDDPPSLARGAATVEEALAHYRRVRDEIRDFVECLPESIIDPAEYPATGLTGEPPRKG